MLQRSIVPAMDSANARDCLLHLAKTKLSEREDLVQLNDKFIDIIEHVSCPDWQTELEVLYFQVHYMEAEHAALEHDYNLLKSGVQTDSSGINEIFELEIKVSNFSRHPILSVANLRVYSVCGHCLKTSKSLGNVEHSVEHLQRTLSSWW